MPNYAPFLKDFFDQMVDIFEIDRGYENSVDYYPMLKVMRERLFEKHNLSAVSIDEKELINQLPQSVKLTLDEVSLSHQDFVDVVFLKKTTLKEKALSKYFKNIHDNDNWVAGCYQFQVFLNDKEYDLNDFRENVLKCFESFESGGAFELLSNVAVFIEAYGQTHEGKEFLYKEFDLNDYQKSFRELFKRMNNASVFNAIAVKDGEDGELKCQYSSGKPGDFDGLYIFPDDKGGLMVRQIQISATSDMGAGIEKNSVFRHAISNIIIAKALDTAFVKRNETRYEKVGKEDYIEHESLTEPFKVSPKEYKDEKIDMLQDQKQKALLKIMKEHYGVSFNGAKDFGALVKHLNAELYHYIFKCFGEKPPLKAYAVEDTLKSLKHVDVANVFVAKTSYGMHSEYKQSTLGQALGNDVDLNMKEFRNGLQLTGLSTFNTDNKGNAMFLQNEGLKIAFSGILSRCMDDKGEVDATKLNKLGQKAFETLIFNHFILGDVSDIQKNYDVINKSEVKESFKFYLSRILLRDQEGESLYDTKLKELDLDTNQNLQETCEKLLALSFLDYGEDLHNQLTEKLKRIEAENKSVEEKNNWIEEKNNWIEEKNKRIESDIKNLNNVLRYPDDKEMYSDNISGNYELENLYSFLKESGFDGRFNKVELNDYNKALIEINQKPKIIDELEFPSIDKFDSSSKSEIISKSSCKAPKSK